MVGRDGVEPPEVLANAFTVRPAPTYGISPHNIHSFDIAENEELQLPTQIFNVERS